MIPPRLRPPHLIPLLASLALTCLSGRSLRAEMKPVAIMTGSALAEPPASAHPPAKDDIHGRLNLGSTLTERGEYESAEIAYRQVLEASDASSVEETKSALLGLARMYRKQRFFVKAVAIYQKYLQEYPGDERTPDVLLETGRTMRSMGSTRLALSRFYSVINSTLKLPDKGFEHYQQLAKTAQFEIAETHFESGDYAEAAKFFSRLRLLDLAPADRARAHFKAAYALKLQGDQEGSVTLLCTFLEQFPSDENVPEARYLLATTLRSLGRPQEALATTLELLRSEQAHDSTDPKRWAYWQRRTGNQLANDFFEHGDILNAQAIYTGLAALSDDPAWRLPVQYQIALCHERLGSLDRARLTYQEVIDTSKKTSAPGLIDLGRMAQWRLANLDWNDSIRHQVTTMFETTTGRPAPVMPTPKLAAPL
ncbi:MAG: tetratricopeptide repeat protein [Opitutaceae bacterium]